MKRGGEEEMKRRVVKRGGDEEVRRRGRGKDESTRRRW